jgi:hypothetical protein
MLANSLGIKLASSLSAIRFHVSLFVDSLSSSVPERVDVPSKDGHFAQPRRSHERHSEPTENSPTVDEQQ